VARRKNMLEETAERMKNDLGSDGKVVISAQDVGTEEGVKAVVKDTIDTFGSMFQSNVQCQITVSKGWMLLSIWLEFTPSKP